MFRFFRTSIFFFSHLILIIFSQNREITLLVDRQISWIDRVDFDSEKDKKIEFNKFCRLDLDQIYIFLDIITFDHRLDNHDSFVLIVELFKNHVHLERSWIDDEKHLRYRIDSKIKKQQKWNETKKFETMIRLINKRFWIIERLNANQVHNCRILLTDERMNCYCCLFKMNEKFSLLYKKSLSFIYLLIFIFWFIEIHLRIEIFVYHEDFFFWLNHLRSSLSFRFNFIRIAYLFSNSLTFRRSRK
jgi:hypothetical protein